MGKKQFWNFKNEGTENPELEIYGEIASTSWWGDEVTPKEFSKQLKEAVKNSDSITVRINSDGGDVFAAHAIYCMLRDCNKKVTVKIDGWAASAATTVAMAGDEILIPKMGIFMIHDPAMYLRGQYKAGDMEKFQSELETVKSSIIKIYAEKTGKKEEEISRLMSDETWLLGDMAVEQGFCTGLLFENVEAAKDINNSLHYIVNKVDFDISKFKISNGLNALIKGDGHIKQPQIITNSERNENMEEKEEIKTVEQLTNAYPDLVKQIVDKERQRIKDIEECAVPGFEDIAQEAKYTKPCTAADMALNIVKAQKSQGSRYISDSNEDLKNSGLEGSLDLNDRLKNSVGNKPENEALKILDEIEPIVK